MAPFYFNLHTIFWVVILKIEIIDEDNFNVWLVTDEKRDLSELDTELSIKNFLGEIVLKLKKILKGKFYGYYELTAYKAYNIFFLEFERLDEYHIGVEINTVIYLDSKILFKYEDLGILKPDYYYDGYFYKMVDDVFLTLKFIEFGEFVHEEEANLILNKAVKLS